MSFIGSVAASDSVRARLLVNGGQYPSSFGIEYVELTTFGNGISYGNLTVTKRATSAAGGKIYGLNISGWTDNGYNTNRTDRLTFLTLGSASLFLDVGFGYSGASAGNSIYAFNAGAWQTGQAINRLAYSTSGSYTFIGNLVRGRAEPTASSSPTRGLWIGGGDYSGGTYPTYGNIDLITFTTTGNATTFGTLPETRQSMQSGASATRMLISGGYNRVHPNNYLRNDIRYLTFSTTGNSTFFGNLGSYRIRSHGGSNDTIAAFVSGSSGANQTTAADTQSMERSYIATLGNSVVFGNLITARSSMHGACTNAHGGLK